MTDLIPGVAEAKTAGAVLKMLAPFAGALAIAAGGFTAAEVYEHKAPWGLGPKLAHAEALIGVKNTALLNAATALRQAAADLKRDVTSADNQTDACTHSNSDAITAGRAIERALGHDPVQPPLPVLDPGGKPVPGVVSLRDVFEPGPDPDLPDRGDGKAAR